MFWETIAAALMMIGTLPLWLTVAAFWGLLKAIASFVSMFVAWVTAPQIDWESVWAAPIGALHEGAYAAFSVPSSMWEWAKYERPWLAAAIGLFILLASNGRKPG